MSLMDKNVTCSIARVKFKLREFCCSEIKKQNECNEENVGFRFSFCPPRYCLMSNGLSCLSPSARKMCMAR